MAREERELLIVLDEGSPESTRARLVELGSVVHRASPRVLVLALSGGAETARRLPGVLAAGSGGPPAEVMSRLGDEERLFVEAWLARSASKNRRGEGLSWDAPGFHPPDSEDNRSR